MGKPSRSRTGSSPRTWGTRRVPEPQCRETTVHPHARGEHDVRLDCVELEVGSSPRTWGTHPSSTRVTPSWRFIPTHVGNTSRTASRYVWQDGSSPRTWGTHDGSAVLGQQRRFIPTHVGNTSQSQSWCPTCPVHPHARGEHGGARPRFISRTRFIPTHVGNTGYYAGYASVPPVHPHARGEHRTSRCFDSPAMRFIPTHVGNTAKGSEGSRAHGGSSPRTWGTHPPSATIAPQKSGSSPRTWGTRHRYCAARRTGRFIPTHVGNTAADQAVRSALAVHPHARGEHFTTTALRTSDSGSSPRTWGTRFRHGWQSGRIRFIPTHVGNTAPARFCDITQSVHPHARGEHKTGTGTGY